MGRERQARPDVFARQVRKVSKDIVFRHAGCEVVKDVRNRDSESRMHGFPLRLPASIVIRCWYSMPVSAKAFARQVKNAEDLRPTSFVRVITRSLDVSSVLILATWVRLA